MLTHKEFKTRMLEDPAVLNEYERPQLEMVLLDVLLSAREEAGLAQSEVALRMGTMPLTATVEMLNVEKNRVLSISDGNRPICL